MNITLEISEPWDLPVGISPTLSLKAENPQKSDQAWRVQIVSGWMEGNEIQEATLRPRYKGQALRELLDGQSIIVNLVTIGRAPRVPRYPKMVSGRAFVRANSNGNQFGS